MRVVVIGNGIAGNSAAYAIREADKDTAITIISMEAVPLYSACVLPHYLSGQIPRERVFLTTPEYQNGIDAIPGCKVTQIDVKGSKVLLDNGKNIPFDKLIIATGSKPTVPPIEGIDRQGIFTLKSLADADGILNFPGKKAVVIGSGLIGLEAAIALKEKGCQVSVVELLDWIMPRVFDKEPAERLTRIIEDHGVKVFTGERVQRISGNGRVRGVVTDRQEIDCDMVILAAGMRPDIELARQAGMKLGELGGISTDKQMMTSVENIYACGDCVEADDIITGKPTLSLLWHNAREQGIVAGSNCIGIERSYPGSLDMTGLNVFGTHAISIGKTMSYLERDNIELIERGHGKKYRRFLIADGRVVGIQIIGGEKYVGMLCSVMRRGDDINRAGEAVPGKDLGVLQLLAIVNNYLRQPGATQRR